MSLGACRRGGEVLPISSVGADRGRESVPVGVQCVDANFVVGKQEHIIVVVDHVSQWCRL